MDTETMQVFDLRRLFLGDLPLVFVFEILFRTAWMYLWALLVSRLLGKRAVGQMTAFDNIIVIAVGSATGDPMFMFDIPLLHGMVVLSGVMGLERLLSAWSTRSGRVERAIESTPTPLVRDGHILHNRLSQERMTEGELMSLLRLQGIRDVGEVERAWLEPTGSVSIFPFEKPPSEETRSTWPPRKIEDDPL